MVAKGSVCQSCLTDHRTTHRLLRHLYNVAACRHRYLAADLGHDGPVVLARSGSRSSWQPPYKINGPLPFWATLSPLQQDPELLRDNDLRCSLVAFADVPLADAKGRVLANRARDLFALVSSSGATSEEVRAAFDELPIDTPSLSVLSELTEIFLLASGSESGATELLVLKAQWRNSRILVARLEACFSDKLIAWLAV